MYSKVAEGLYIGDSRVSEDPLFFSINDITAIIRLDNIHTKPIDVIEYIVPGYELLDMEIPSIVKKLGEICDMVSELRVNRRSVLIQCNDGKNKSALVAAYFLINRCGLDVEKTISHISTIYYTDEQRGEELMDIERLNKVQRGEIVPNPTPEDVKKQQSRNGLRALTNRSFKKILRWS
jgi:hypothetical protein